MKAWLRVLLVAGLLAAVAGPASALRFSYANQPIRVHAAPGQTINRSFRLSLPPEERGARFRFRVEDWYQSEDGRQSFYKEPGTLARSCARWTKINPVEATLTGGKSLDVRVTIEIPTDAKPGGYWCALTTDEIPDPEQAPTEGPIGIRFRASISVGLYVFIAPLEQQARILSVAMDREHASLTLRNDGNCPLSVEGRFEFLTPGSSEPKAIVSFPRGPLLTEPSNRAVFSCALPKASDLPSGRYLVRVVIDMGLDHYLAAQKEMTIQREQDDGARRD